MALGTNGTLITGKPGRYYSQCVIRERLCSHWLPPLTQSLGELGRGQVAKSSAWEQQLEARQAIP